MCDISLCTESQLLYGFLFEREMRLMVRNFSGAVKIAYDMENDDYAWTYRRITLIMEQNP